MRAVLFAPVVLSDAPRGRVLALAALLAAAGLAGCVQIAPQDGGDDDAAGPATATLDCDVAPGPASWTEPCLTFASPNDSPSKTEVDVAVNPTDPDNVVVSSKDLDPKASPCVWAVPQVSKDAGRTWTTAYIGGEEASRAPTDRMFGWKCVTDPIMAFDADGTLYYSLQAYDHTVEAADLPEPLRGQVFAVGSAIIAARSTDGGLTWDKFATLHAGDGANVFHDYMRVLVNPATGTYHTIWNQFTGPATVVPVLVSWDGESDAAGPPVYVPVTDRPQGVTMAGFAAANDGTLYVLQEDGDDAWFTKSADDGKTWSASTRTGAEKVRPSSVDFVNHASSPSSIKT